LGYVLGGGLDYRLDSRWSARAEYLYTRLGLTGFTFASAPGIMQGAPQPPQWSR
jgi:high affinity Mn2+ porin